jgi:hypothetical protein
MKNVSIFLTASLLLLVTLKSNAHDGGGSTFTNCDSVATYFKHSAYRCQISLTGKNESKSFDFAKIYDEPNTQWQSEYGLYDDVHYSTYNVAKGVDITMSAVTKCNTNKPSPKDIEIIVYTAGSEVSPRMNTKIELNNPELVDGGVALASLQISADVKASITCQKK